MEFIGHTIIYVGYLLVPVLIETAPEWLAAILVAGRFANTRWQAALIGAAVAFVVFLLLVGLGYHKAFHWQVLFFPTDQLRVRFVAAILLSGLAGAVTFRGAAKVPPSNG